MYGLLSNNERHLDWDKGHFIPILLCEEKKGVST